MSTFPDKFRLDGRTALVTGSARGLGWEMAKGLAEAGARVLLHGRSHKQMTPRLAELRAAGHDADALAFEMADRAAMAAEVAAAGRIDPAAALADQGTPEFALQMGLDALVVAPDAAFPAIDALAAKAGLPVILLESPKTPAQAADEAVRLALSHRQSAGADRAPSSSTTAARAPFSNACLR